LRTIDFAAEAAKIVAPIARIDSARITRKPREPRHLAEVYRLTHLLSIAIAKDPIVVSMRQRHHFGLISSRKNRANCDSEGSAESLRDWKSRKERFRGAKRSPE